MSEPVAVVAAKLDALAAQVATGQAAHEIRVHLYTNPIGPTENSQLADFDEATYGGYVSQVVSSWGLPFRDVLGVYRIATEDLQFQPTDSVTPNVIYGAYITQGSPTTLLFAERFDQPVPFNGPSDGLLYTPRINYGE